MAHVSIPKVQFNDSDFGQFDEFTVGAHDSLDGFLKAKDECVVVLPQLYKLVSCNANTGVSGSKESFEKKVTLCKQIVLPYNYEF